MDAKSTKTTPHALLVRSQKAAAVCLARKRMQCHVKHAHACPAPRTAPAAPQVVEGCAQGLHSCVRACCWALNSTKGIVAGSPPHCRLLAQLAGCPALKWSLAAAHSAPHKCHALARPTCNRTRPVCYIDRHTRVDSCCRRAASCQGGCENRQTASSQVPPRIPCISNPIKNSTTERKPKKAWCQHSQPHKVIPILSSTSNNSFSVPRTTTPAAMATANAGWEPGGRSESASFT